MTAVAAEKLPHELCMAGGWQPAATVTDVVNPAT
jgi:hypothetical protein